MLRDSHSRFIENSVGNVVRKVLKLIRDEYVAITGSQGASATVATLHHKASSLRPTFSRPGQDHSSTGFASTSSVAQFVLKGRPAASLGNGILQSGTETPDTAYSDDIVGKAQKIKPALIDAIQEVIDELETVYENIAKNARDYIHSEYALCAYSKVIDSVPLQ